MTTYTSPDNLPAPDDPQAPADSISAFQALAAATQTAISAVRATAVSRVIDSLSGTNADIAPSQKSVKAAIDAIAARVISAGTGLTGGGSLAASRTLSLDVGYTDGRYARIAAEGSTEFTDRFLGVRVLDFGTLAAGAESGVQSFNIRDGSYVFASVQHHSTYIFASCNIATTGSTQRVDVKVRNTTTQTTHTNIKVHCLVVNP